MDDKSKELFLKVLEEVAKQIYQNQAEDNCSGENEKIKAWKLDAQIWNKEITHNYEISQWERDDYRASAKIAMITLFKMLNEKQFINLYRLILIEEVMDG